MSMACYRRSLVAGATSFSLSFSLSLFLRPGEIDSPSSPTFLLPLPVLIRSVPTADRSAVNTHHTATDSSDSLANVLSHFSCTLNNASRDDNDDHHHHLDDDDDDDYDVNDNDGYDDDDDDDNVLWGIWSLVDNDDPIGECSISQRAIVMFATHEIQAMHLRRGFFVLSARIM